MKIEAFSAKPVSMVTSGTTGRQRVELAIRSNFNGHVKLRVFQDDVRIGDDFDLALQKGENNRIILVPPPVSKVMGRMELYGEVVSGKSRLSSMYSIISLYKVNDSSDIFLSVSFHI